MNEMSGGIGSDEDNAAKEVAKKVLLLDDEKRQRYEKHVITSAQAVKADAEARTATTTAASISTYPAATPGPETRAEKTLRLIDESRRRRSSTR